MKKAILVIIVFAFIASLLILSACNIDGGDENNEVTLLIPDEDEETVSDETDLLVIGNEEAEEESELSFPAPEGVYMSTEKTTYPSDVQSIHVVWNNNTDKAITFGEPFYLEKKEKGGWKWEKVDTLQPIFFISIGHVLMPYSQSEHYYHINYIYGDLEVGNYRIVTDLSVTADVAHLIYADFIIVNKAADTDIQNDDSLFAEYGLEITGANCWNDYMPMAYSEDDMPPEDWVKPTLCVIVINSEEELPLFSVFATIILNNGSRLENIPFYYNSGWRPMVDLVFYGDYTMEITLQIGQRQQTAILSGTVQVTY